MSDQKPSVGRIVHFYNQSLAEHANNFIGKGPYVAVVTQMFPGSSYVNLKILPYGDPWDEGSVSEKSDANNSRYWEWPPRV